MPGDGGGMFRSRVTVLVGHFGSGKTEIAINRALAVAGGSTRVALVDLDVVKPYFRSRSARALMAERGVDLVAPEGENVFADLPIIVPRIRTLVRDPAVTLIIDAGGDPTGARALGSLADVIPDGDTETLLVANFRRPFTTTAEEAVTMAREIEAASRRRISGVVSNTHLMSETTPEIVSEGYALAVETAARLGVPVVAVMVDEATRERVSDGAFDCPVVTLHRIVKPPFEPPNRGPKVGPLFVVN